MTPLQMSKWFLVKELCFNIESTLLMRGHLSCIYSEVSVVPLHVSLFSSKNLW